MAVHAGLVLRTNRTSAIPSRRERDELMDRVGAEVQRISRWLGPALLLFAIALPMLPFADRPPVDIGPLVPTYVMLGWGLLIVVGLAGLLGPGYMTFFLLGAPHTSLPAPPTPDHS